GTGRQDAIFINECYARNRIKNRKERLRAWRELAVFACASCSTQELRNESLQQGAAFVQVTRSAWPHARMDEGYSILGENTPYPVCFGLAAAAHRVERSQACRAYLLALAASWISAAIRLNLTGQTNGQKILATMAPVADLIATQTRDGELDDLGSCTFANDLASLKHAVLPARLFRS
ncbi:MAG: urease accessory protein UreF, partial [Alphaproteobacteria bacterium]|nr:urease accessory protein UreF [Alphaproteobacteria bacterium]